MVLEKIIEFAKGKYSLAMTWRNLKKRNSDVENSSGISAIGINNIISKLREEYELKNKGRIPRKNSSRQRKIFYIGGTDVLPPPMTTEEEKKYVTLLSEGDLSAKNTLIERNLRLVVYIAKKFENVGINIEDLISIGTIGLIKAVNTFNVKKNIKLATYASRCIENEILMFLRRNNKTRGDVSFDEPLNVDMDGNELLLSDILGTESDMVCANLEEEINKKLLLQAMSKLTKRENDIIEMRFGLISREEMTQKEVADKLGISQSYISRLEKKIINKLRKEINKLI